MPKKKYIDDKFLQALCLEYEEKYKHDNYKPVVDPDTGKKLIEPVSKFMFPLIVEPDIEVLFAGTMDEVDYYHNSDMFSGSCGYNIDDCKVSGAFNTYEFFDEYILNPQLIAYRWAIKKYAKYRPTSIWGKIDRSPNVTARIDGVFYRAPSAEENDKEKKSIQLLRGKPIVFTQKQIAEFEEGVMKVFWELVHYARRWKQTGELPPRQGVVTHSCRGQFGPCKYVGVCSAVDQEAATSILSRKFIKRFYNPMSFDDEKGPVTK